MVIMAYDALIYPEAGKTAAPCFLQKVRTSLRKRLVFSTHFFVDPIRAPKCVPDSYSSIRICAYDFPYLLRFGHAQINFMKGTLLARA